MIASRHSRWAHLVFRFYLKRLLVRHFESVRLVGDPPAFVPDRPILCLPNHSTWWDGFLIYWLNHLEIRREAYLMMLEDQLRRNSFFRRIGAYSIQPGKPGAVRESLRYGAEKLSRAADPPLVVVFPQGELLPWDPDGLVFRPGVELLLRQCRQPVQVCLLGIRAEFTRHQRPVAHLKFMHRRLHDPETPCSPTDLQEEMRSGLRGLQQDIYAGAASRLLLQGRASINERRER